MLDLLTLENLFTLLMLVLLQAVLGFDNLLYISIESKRVEKASQAKVRRLGIMLAIGYWKPATSDWTYQNTAKVSLKPWRYAQPVSATMLAGIVMLYLLFSPVGLVDGLSVYFWWSILGVILINTFACWYTLKRYDAKHGR